MIRKLSRSEIINNFERSREVIPSTLDVTNEIEKAIKRDEPSVNSLIDTLSGKTKKLPRSQRLKSDLEGGKYTAFSLPEMPSHQDTALLKELLTVTRLIREIGINSKSISTNENNMTNKYEESSIDDDYSDEESSIDSAPSAQLTQHDFDKYPDLFCSDSISDWKHVICSNQGCKKLHTELITHDSASVRHTESRNQSVITASTTVTASAITKTSGATGITTSTVKTGSDLKNRAFSRGMNDFEIYGKCNKECRHGQKCVEETTLEELMNLTISFWGKRKTPPPAPSNRKSIIIKLMREHGVKQRDSNNTFILEFVVGNRTICEASYLWLIGCSPKKNSSEAGTQWRKCRDDFLGNVVNQISEKDKLKNKLFQHTNRSAHCAAFLQRLADSKIKNDTFASGHGVKQNQFNEEKLVMVLPYTKAIEVYDDYRFQFPDLNVLKYGKFKQIFDGFVKDNKFKLMGCKGSFPTCAVCNACTEMLRKVCGKGKDKKLKLTWDAGQRDIIEKYKKAHLMQQETERMHKEMTKQKCREEDPRTGFANEAFIYGDAMTSSTGDIPKPFIGAISQKGDVIENRLFAVEIICGSLSFVIFVSVNQLINGGANLIIEIQRLSIQKLAAELEKVGKKMPRMMTFQFDNCGENKNKEMYAYASLLVERGYLDCININFLIVGHTHDSLDQIFSVLSKKIKNSIILTIPALHELYSKAHSNFHDRPLHVLQLEVVHDWCEFFKPFLNDRISRYSIPHRFKITRFLGKAVCQYMLYTPQFGTAENWCPKLPRVPSMQELASVFKVDANNAEEMAKAISLFLEKDAVTEVPIKEFDLCNGQASLEKELGIYKLDAIEIARNDEKRAIMDNLGSVTDQITEIEINAISTQILHMDMQSRGVDLSQDNAYGKKLMGLKSAIANALIKQKQSKESGYMVWLRDVNAVAKDAEHNIYFDRPLIVSDLTDVDGDISKKPVTQQAEWVAFMEAAEKIAGVCRRVISDTLKNPTISLIRNAKCIEDATGDFKCMSMSDTELDWLLERDTASKLVDRAKRLQKDAINTPWVLMHQPQLPDSLMEEIEKERQAKDAAVTLQCNISLLPSKAKPFLRLLPEIIGKDGGYNLNNIMEILLRPGRSSDQTGCGCSKSDCSTKRCACIKDNSKKCVAGCACDKLKCKNFDSSPQPVLVCVPSMQQVCDVIECNGAAKIICPEDECGRLVCDMHGQNGHVSHSNGIQFKIRVANVLANQQQELPTRLLQSIQPSMESATSQQQIPQPSNENASAPKKGKKSKKSQAKNEIIAAIRNVQGLVRNAAITSTDGGITEIIQPHAIDTIAPVNDSTARSSSTIVTASIIATVEAILPAIDATATAEAILPTIDNIPADTSKEPAGVDISNRFSTSTLPSPKRLRLGYDESVEFEIEANFNELLQSIQQKFDSKAQSSSYSLLLNSQRYSKYDNAAIHRLREHLKIALPVGRVKAKAMITHIIDEIVKRDILC